MFVFPYDWRQGNKRTADLLKDTIDEILSRTGAEKVDIIAHSMGGLVAKQYVAQYGEGAVDQIIFLGTPHYGAAKSLKVLLFGDSLSVPSFILNPLTIRDITRNMPAMYELLPSQKYFSEYNSYVIDTVDVDGDGNGGRLDWDETRAFAANMGLNDLLYGRASDFHAAVDNWSPSPALEARVHNIVGCAEPTIGRIIAGYKKGGKVKWQAWMVEGDETVPLRSARGTAAGSEYYLPHAQHFRLPDNEIVRDIVVDILDDNSVDLAQPQYDEIRQGEDNCGFSGFLLSIHSPVAVHAYDTAGRHTGANDEGGIDVEIPGSQYFELDGNSFIYIPEGVPVTFQLYGTGEGTWQASLSFVDETGPVQSAQFMNNPAAASLRATLTLGNNPDLEEVRIMVDSDGDGEIDEVLYPDTVVQGGDAADITPPEISFANPAEERYLNTRVVPVRFSVQDSESGVFLQQAFLDGLPFNSDGIDLRFLEMGKHIVSVEAYDRTGNFTEAEAAFEVYTTFSALKKNLRFYYRRGLIKATAYYRLRGMVDSIAALDKARKRLAGRVGRIKGIENHVRRKEEQIMERLGNFIQEVEKEKGKGVNPNAANLLINQAEYLRNGYSGI